MTLVCCICLFLFGSNVLSSPKDSFHNSTKLQSMKYMQMKPSFHGHAQTHKFNTAVQVSSTCCSALYLNSFGVSKACFKSKTIRFWRENEIESDRDIV